MLMVWVSWALGQISESMSKAIGQWLELSDGMSDQCSDCWWKSLLGCGDILYSDIDVDPAGLGDVLTMQLIVEDEVDEGGHQAEQAYQI